MGFYLIVRIVEWLNDRIYLFIKNRKKVKFGRYGFFQRKPLIRYDLTGEVYKMHNLIEGGIV